MAQGISIHVVDVARGLVAAGMRVEVYALSGERRPIAAGLINERGVLPSPELDRRFSPGAYEACFHVAEFYRSIGVALPQVPFLDVVTYRFGIADPDSHYHLPFKLTPWGYSLFRGGA
jgi:5-hydroxyisourate hydrolase